MRRNFALLLLPLLSPAAIVNAQACQPQPVIIDALDARGVPITTLTTSDFRASYKGRPLSILSANLRVDPSTRTFVLLDTGARMGDTGAQGINKWKIARSAAEEFITAAPPQAQISLITFSSTLGRTLDSTNGRQPMKEWLGSPEMLGTSSLKGKTALYAALRETLKAMQPTRPGDAIYIITDGHDNPSDGTVSRMAEQLRANGVRLFVFLLNDMVGDNQYNFEPGEVAVGGHGRPTLGPGALSDLARASGGLVFSWYPGGRSSTGQSFASTIYEYDESTLAGIRRIVHWIENAIIGFYILNIDVANGPSQLGEWKVEVVNAQGHQRKDITLAYPKTIEGCTPLRVDTPTKDAVPNHQ
jgi:hypothetical protein